MYVLVNLALYAAAMVSGRHGVIAPFLAWGLGLAIHGAVVWLAWTGARLYQHLLEREIARLQPQRDPW